MKKLSLLLPAIVFLNGCFFGTFQTARPIAPGSVDSGWYVNIPLYTNKNVRESQKSSGTAFTIPNIGGHVSYGASDFAEFGLYGSLGEGIGPFGKFLLLSEDSYPFSFGLLAGFAYHLFAQGLSWKLDLILSRNISPYASIYGGFHYCYQPDYRTNLPGDADIWHVSTFRNFQQLFVGIELARSREVKKSLQKMPYSITMEFGVPLVSQPAIFVGFQFKI